ncbi:4-(cytidine 5'-diphospho)-2-C-methyl-D-erythritol kinase [Aestuariirhabdus sp. Z084]|uniref:4-(cytidine 5'-diphospho)-2-C-methyl-D-erythritol kinase n=1 Tax=Aestuariirhabdus haliotis TaxID=2918751 RepID=UPI00201B359A|nr:4-(cytidine 5'-diphospho)-2-C-methyl-D-erythritol kinase [Aestuariirhabdus haliotis]MCL6415192.1 4-(cytidine 5'-diphospho)-2-C-methyl-D-erythritol kinase [Aestuariirhabdus haliotis]MCL6420067.1 4-(cytidine 5'-diphospho)-2-C-methyl-D-erythritol kinase [Aestuariirhabdus haliotis]
MSRQLLDLPAPAKINLFLHITGRRNDGYHELQTLFQFLDIGDSLSFESQDDTNIDLCPVLPGVPNASNLIVQAAQRLQQATGCQQGARIQLNKYLPMGGGLGGGSSDAATTLIALNQLWGTGLSLQELASLGLELGADVPVFIGGYACWAEGVGEQLSPVTLPTPWYLIVLPGCEVATAEVFGHPDLRRDSPPITLQTYQQGLTRNDCEALVRRLKPAVDNGLTWLRQYGPGAMSGTGASLFCPFDSERAAQQALSQLPAPMKGFVAQGCNRSLLHQRLQIETETL